MKKRCLFCNKKLGLITFNCKCGGMFCVAHQTTHSHNCKSNEKQEETKKNLEKSNPSVLINKVNKI
jgi:AN1-type zinc finger protein 5/6